MKQNFAIFFHQNSHKFYLYLFLFAFSWQFIFWTKTNNIKPNYNLIPDVPNQYFIKASSFGDEEFLFRINATKIQNAGDVFAGFVSLKLYDYNKLYQWFMLLDELNYQSNLTPSLAAYIFANSKKEQDLKLIIKYLRNHGNKDLDKNWWWIFQAIYIASNVLQDNETALELAYELSQNQDSNAPLWTKQMPAFIYAKKNDGCAAFFVIKNIIDEVNSSKREISVEEMDFMRYFINIRLKKLKDNKFNPQNCKNNL